jgi:hypothetical protein
LPSEAITDNISREFEKQYGKKLNRIEIQKFLKELLTGLSGLSNAQMVELIKRGGLKPKEYGKIIKSLYDDGTATSAEPVAEPQAAAADDDDDEFEDAMDFRPETVGDYNLRNVKEEARTALSVKAKQVLLRNKMPINQENMLEAIRQLIDDINKSGIKRIPTTSMSGLSYNK